VIDARQPFSDFQVRLVDGTARSTFSRAPAFDVRQRGRLTGGPRPRSQHTKRKRAEAAAWLEHT